VHIEGPQNDLTQELELLHGLSDRTSPESPEISEKSGSLLKEVLDNLTVATKAGGEEGSNEVQELADEGELLLIHSLRPGTNLGQPPVGNCLAVVIQPSV
jgi:hypothetical protein